jgi:hypothetical protein
VKALRRFYTEAAIKPGDYVLITKLRRPCWSKVKAGGPYWVIDIKTDEYVGVTEDNPYYVLDSSDAGVRYQGGYYVLSEEIEVTDRPYLGQAG